MHQVPCCTEYVLGGFGMHALQVVRVPRILLAHTHCSSLSPLSLTFPITHLQLVSLPDELHERAEAATPPNPYPRSHAAMRRLHLHARENKMNPLSSRPIFLFCAAPRVALCVGARAAWWCCGQ